MTYQITRTNGSQYSQGLIPDSKIINVLDKNSSYLSLIGKLSADYGEDQSNNFFHLVENFANEKFPSDPVVGMLCFRIDSDYNGLYMCVNETSDVESERWKKILSINFDDSGVHQAGDIYYNKEEKKFYVYDDTVGDNGGWVLIGPQNFYNKENISTILESTSDITSSNIQIDIQEESANLVTIKAVAKEKMDKGSNPEFGIRNPETASWIIRLLVESHKLSNGANEVIIVGQPNYETIGKTSGQALNWVIEPTIFDNRLMITVSGVGTDNPLVTPEMDWVEWELDIEIVKV